MESDFKKVLLVKTPVIAIDDENTKDIQTEIENSFLTSEPKYWKKIDKKKHSFVSVKFTRDKAEIPRLSRVSFRRLLPSGMVFREPIKTTQKSISPISVKDVDSELNRVFHKSLNYRKIIAKRNFAHEKHPKTSQFDFNLFVVNQDSIKKAPNLDSFVLMSDFSWSPTVKSEKSKLPFLYEINRKMLDNRIKVRERLVTPTNLNRDIHINRERPNTSLRYRSKLDYN